MSSRHRPYRPKIKGCYECSQRRVSCDRSTPECSKCLSKGLRCSGLDLRYRFTKGVTIRGKWAGESVQSLYERGKNLATEPEDHETQKAQRCPSQTARRSFKDDPTVSAVCETGTSMLDMSMHQEFLMESQEASVVQEFLNYSLPQRMLDHRTVPGHYEDLDLSETAFLPESPGSSSLNLGRGVSNVSHSEIEYSSGGADLFQGNSTPSPNFSNTIMGLLYEPSPNNLSCWEEALISNYSHRIAKEMLAIDGPHNGWRSLLLPIAHRDRLVMNAVLTASAFHISLSQIQGPILHNGAVHTSPDYLYERTIQGLKARDLAECSFVEMQSIIATILVLLIAVMVNGRNDFPILFSLLDSAINAIGGESRLAGNELGDFMLRQVRKLRVYGAPLISEQYGLKILSSTSQWEGVFDCLRHCSQKQPNHSVAAASIEDIIHQARDIYLQQALNLNENRCIDPKGFISPSDSNMDHRLQLERFKESIEAFPVRSPGKQVLIWAFFIVASSCTQEHDQAFFERILLENFNRSKFRNLLQGLAQLRNIWARRADGVGTRWTHLLPQAQLFLM